jgi:hypothetical protein
MEWLFPRPWSLCIYAGPNKDLFLDFRKEPMRIHVQRRRRRRRTQEDNDDEEEG